MIIQGVYRPIETAWLFGLARKARAGGMPEPFTAAQLFEGLAETDRCADHAAVRDGEDLAICDIILADNDAILAFKVLDIMTTARAEFRTGYLWAICRAAYCGSLN